MIGELISGVSIAFGLPPIEVARRSTPPAIASTEVSGANSVPKLLQASLFGDVPIRDPGLR